MKSLKKNKVNNMSNQAFQIEIMIHIIYMNDYIINASILILLTHTNTHALSEVRLTLIFHTTVSLPD